MDLELFPERLAVHRLRADATPPEDIGDGFFATLRDANELTVVMAEARSLDDALTEAGWRRLRVAGTLDFSLVGIIADLSAALADASISVFVISSYDTDHILVKDTDVARATVALEARGHRIRSLDS